MVLFELIGNILLVGTSLVIAISILHSFSLFVLFFDISVGVDGVEKNDAKSLSTD